MELKYCKPFKIKILKLGKSVGNTTIWLSANKTSPYHFYQYFIKVTDADVENFLKIFTFKQLEEIADIVKKHAQEPDIRTAQQELAFTVTSFVHGTEAANAAKLTSELLFGKAKNIDPNTLLQLTSWIPCHKLYRQNLVGIPITTLAALTKLQSSKGAAKRIIESGGMYINNARVTDTNKVIEESDIIEGKVCVLRTGQSNYMIIIPE